MQNITSTLGRLAVVLTGALALGSCSRAEYAFLPKSASYLGTTTAAPKARIAAAPAPTPAPVAQAPTAAPASQAPAVAPEIVVATTPAAPRAAKVVAPTPPAPAEAAAAAPKAATLATTAPKQLNLVQRLAVNKIMHKLEKQTQKIAARQGNNTASTARGGIDGKLRYAIIFGAIGLIFFVIGGSFANTIGTILFIVALLFLLFWLLDNL